MFGGRFGKGRGRPLKEGVTLTFFSLVLYRKIIDLPRAYQR